MEETKQSTEKNNGVPRVDVVQNVAAVATDAAVENYTRDTFERVVNLNIWESIAIALANRLADELAEKSFMTTDLELTEKQRETLQSAHNQLVNEVVRNYKAQVANEERAKDVYKIVKQNMRAIINRTLSQIGAEINRGALINAVAVSADSKGKDFNKIELQYFKDAGDITIPTKGIFISTNCIDTIRDSIKLDELEAQNERGE